MPRVSVVMPYYKKANYIEKSINSVLRQGYKNFEIIIIYDDQDREDTKLIKKIKKKDTRISVIYNTKNLGAGRSRNLGIKKSRGDYIAFLDCDDIWYPNKLELQIKFMCQKKADFSFTSYDLIDEKNKKKGIRVARDILEYNDLIKSCDIGLSTVIVKKKLFNNFLKFPDLKTKEDYVLWLKFAKKEILLYGLKRQLAKWRITNNSLSSSSKQKILDAFLVYRKYMKFSFAKSCYSIFLLSLNYILKKYS